MSVRSSKQAHLDSEHLIAVGKIIGQIPSGRQAIPIAQALHWEERGWR